MRPLRSGLVTLAVLLGLGIAVAPPASSQQGKDLATPQQQVTTAIPATRNLGYVRTADRVLLIIPPSRIVVGEIKN